MTTVRNIWAIFLRELSAYFLSPTAYVVLFVYLLTNGVTFFVYTVLFRAQSRQIDLVIQHLFGFYPFWILFLLIPPILTMRLFAEEKRTGTLEMLMTSPVTDAQVVAGKFLAAQAYFTLLSSSLLLYVFILEVLGEPDWGPVIAFYVGLVSLGALFNAVGLFASVTTRHQLVAAMIAAATNLFLFILQLCRFFDVFENDPESQRFFDYISFQHHFYNEYSRGVLDLRYPLLYLSFAVLVLFYATRLLEVRRAR